MRLYSQVTLYIADIIISIIIAIFFNQFQVHCLKMDLKLKNWEIKVEELKIFWMA